MEAPGSPGFGHLFCRTLLGGVLVWAWAGTPSALLAEAPLDVGLSTASGKFFAFPEGELFNPPLADPKQPRSHATQQTIRANERVFHFGSVGISEYFNLFRVPAFERKGAVQVGLNGAVFALFNLESISDDLLNADYIVGLPVSVRKGAWSTRWRIYHQSSHLGDKNPINNELGLAPGRLNYSYEAVEWLGSWEGKGLRFYGGPTWISSSLIPLDRYGGELGTEYRSPSILWPSAHFVAALNADLRGQDRWHGDFTAKAGWMLQGRQPESRSLMFLFEYYRGRAPYGQFYQVDVETVGFGILFAL